VGSPSNVLHAWQKAFGLAYARSVSCSDANNACSWYSTLSSRAPSSAATADVSKPRIPARHAGTMKSCCRVEFM